MLMISSGRAWYSTGLLLMVCVGLLAGCQTTSDDPGSIWFRIPKGSRLVLNKPLQIPEGRAHIMLQHGTAATAAGEFEVNCRFEIRELGPQVVEPDTFLIARTGNGRSWFNEPHTMIFFMDLDLRSERQPGVLPMRCQDWDDPLIGRPITVREVQEALGDYFTFEFNLPQPQ